MSHLAKSGVQPEDLRSGENRAVFLGVREGRPSAQAQAFDPFSGRFEPLCTDLEAPRGAPTITTLADGRWLILGGTPTEDPGAEVFRSVPR